MKQKFMFNTMFDEEVIERERAEEEARLEAERLAAENAPPTFTVEEMEAAKDAAYQQGKQAGMAEMMASLEQQANLTLDEVLRKMAELLEEHKRWKEEIQHDSVSLAMSIMRKLAPELLRGSELPQIEHIINEAFRFLTDQPKVMIRVAAELEEQLKGKVNLMASRVGYEGQVVLIGDPELEITDCRISWYAGAVERSLDETWAQIDEMVDRVLNGLPARERKIPEPQPMDDDIADMPEEEDGVLDMSEEDGAVLDMSDEDEGVLDMAEEDEGVLDMPEEDEGVQDMPEEDEGVLDMPEEDEGVLDMPEEDEGVLDMPEEDGAVLDLEDDGDNVLDDGGMVAAADETGAETGDDAGMDHQAEDLDDHELAAQTTDDGNEDPILDPTTEPERALEARE